MNSKKSQNPFSKETESLWKKRVGNFQGLNYKTWVKIIYIIENETIDGLNRGSLLLFF